MKRVFVTIMAGLFVLFLALVVIKFRTSDGKIEQQRDDKKKIVEKDKMNRFWQHYRQATEDRIAGKIEGAAGEYQSALLLNDQHENALYYLGNVYLQLGKFGGAEKVWKRLTQINPNSARAHFQLGILYLSFEQEEFFDIKSAAAEFNRALVINTEETAPLLRLGQIALIRGELAEAGRHFDAVIGANSRNAEAHFLNGYIAWKTSDSRKALSLLGKAVGYSRPIEPVQGVLGEGDTKTGQPLGLADRPTLFRNHLQDLSELDEQNLPQQMPGRYQKLDAYLDQIRSRVIQ